MPITDAPLYTLYAGNRDFLPFSEEGRAAVIATASAVFPSFTLLEATGIYEGRALPTLLIQVATHDRREAETLCVRLGQLLGQRWIGMSDAARYSSIPTGYGTEKIAAVAGSSATGPTNSHRSEMPRG